MPSVMGFVPQNAVLDVTPALARLRVSAALPEPAPEEPAADELPVDELLEQAARVRVPARTAAAPHNSVLCCRTVFISVLHGGLPRAGARGCRAGVRSLLPGA